MTVYFVILHVQLISDGEFCNLPGTASYSPFYKVLYFIILHVQHIVFIIFQVQDSDEDGDGGRDI